MKYTLALPPKRIRKIPLEVKITALHKVYVEGQDVMETLDRIYASYGREVTDLHQAHTILSQWKAAVQKALDRGDEVAITGCRELGMLREEG